jgi:hypothetical protein
MIIIKKISLFILSLIICAALLSPCGARLYASQEALLPSGPGALDINSRYEGRFNIIDPGDSTGRHAIFNILWIDIDKKDTSDIDIAIRAKVFSFEGDSYLKRHNGINELEALTLNEAYIKKSGARYDFNFGMFHERGDKSGDKSGDNKLFDLKDIVYGFDIMNPVFDKKAKGNLYYSRKVNQKLSSFLNYGFSADYSNSLKTYGFKYGDLYVAKAFNSRRDFIIADYNQSKGGTVNYKAGYRRNGFNYLSPFVQYRAGADINLNKEAAGCKLGKLSLELLSNSTSNGYFHLKRNAADLIDGNVIFFYQKYVGALKIELLLNDRFKTALCAESYFAIAPLFTRADGLSEDIGRIRTYKLSALSHYKKAAVEAVLLKTDNNDGSYLLTEKLNFRLRVLYPF